MEDCFAIAALPGRPYDPRAMLQNFDVKGGPQIARRNLPKLRAAMTRAGVDALVVPHEDEYLNEYLPEANERLAWATGFTGSAGAAIILADSAILFVDGRYTTQARVQTDPLLIESRDLVAEGVSGWIEKNAARGMKVGYDPRLHTPEALKPLEDAAERRGAALISLDANPIDEAWSDRPAPPCAPIAPHPLAFAGVPHGDKRARIGDALQDEQIDVAVLTSPASLAWLFNVRGGDIAHTPAPLGAAIIADDGSAELFIDPRKLTDEARVHLGNEVRLRPESEFDDALAGLNGKVVRADPASASCRVFDRLEAAGAEVSRGLDPCALPRACKNAEEIEGSRQAHMRDGAAVTRFLHWLAEDGQSGSVDEISAARKLEAYRREIADLKDLSFESISGAGPNGALPHYRVNVKSNRKLKRGSLYLIDSGGQYPDGTTDITRTVAIGRPKKEMRERYTLVLKGHIALAAIRFPDGTTGTHLDALARMAMWNAGLDYDHGTGHGVGSYLGVHEGPQRIAKGFNKTPLKPGMIVSNEPGYYKEGHYGIRIENLQVVTEPAEIPGGERAMLGFETLTFAPLARNLIIKAMLTKDERSWVDGYHAAVLEKIGPRVSAADREWLEAECAPL